MNSTASDDTPDDTPSDIPDEPPGEAVGGFAAPPFQPQAALQRVQRELRALGLAERAGTFERRGTAIARAVVDGAALKVQVVRQPSRNSPVWQARTLQSHAAVASFCSDLKKQLAAWSDSDD